MQSQKMTSMQASSYRKVGPVSWMKSAWCLPIHVFPGAMVVGNIWWVPSSVLIEKLELSTGQSYRTLPSILNQMCSNRSGFWIQMEPCSTILSWRRCLGSGNGSVLEGTLPMRRCLFLSHLCSQFLTSKEGERVAISFLITQLQALSWGIVWFLPNVRRLIVLPSVPQGFPCSFVLRDSKARDLILADIMSS